LTSPASWVINRRPCCLSRARARRLRFRGRSPRSTTKN
jgi:hypothetical protein